MISSFTLEVFIINKNYYQIVINIFQEYTNDNLENKFFKNSSKFLELE